MSRRAGSIERYAPPPPRRRLRVRSADGTALHAEAHGPEAAPFVVLSHGWTCCTLFWGPVIRELAEDFHVVVYDQRGHGRSAKPQAGGSAGYNTDVLADDLCAVLRACVPEGAPTVLAGHSMGAMTLMAASRRPEVRSRAAAVLLASTGSADLPLESRVLPLSDKRSGLRRSAHRLLLGAPAPLGPVTPLTRSALHYVTMGPDAEPDKVDFITRIVHACPSGARARWGRVLGTLDVREGARHLDVPTAVLAGTADRLTPLVLTRRIAEALPKPDGLTELDGVGHMTPVESPQVFSEMVRGLAAAHVPDAAASAAASSGPDTEALPLLPEAEESA